MDAILFASQLALSGERLVESAPSESRPRASSTAPTFNKRGSVVDEKTTALPDRLHFSGTVDDTKKLYDELTKALERGYAARALQREPHMVLLRDEFYHLKGPNGETSLKEVIARLLVRFLRSQDIATPSEGRPGAVAGGAGAASPGLSDDDVLAYVLERPLPTDDLGKKAALLKPHDRQYLNLTHDILNVYLPHALKKIDRVTFGVMSDADLLHAKKNDPMMPRSRAKLAIPFVSKDVPSPASEFAQPDVVIGLTVLGYRIEGLRFGDFCEALEKLQADFQSEGGAKAERPSALRYAAWITSCGGGVCSETAIDGGAAASAAADGDDCGCPTSPAVKPMDFGERHLPLGLLDRTDERQTKPLFALLRKCPEFIHWYLEQCIFPKFMRFQEHKLSASGQDLGGAMLFSRRIGFSGTPSELLPRDLGACQFEPGSEGDIIFTLTTPRIMSFFHLDDQWNPRSLLRMIATASEGGVPRYHALIDTGALITGLSNLEVARFLVSEPGFLKGIDGVVYLDEADRKMIFMRAQNTMMRLEEASCQLTRRFCFYDQIHTTGMDIKHHLAACAAITLGKDMTWRDYAQGGYRMRGIGKGQTLELLITPEVRQLIRADLAKIGTPAGADAANAASADAASTRDEPAASANEAAADGFEAWETNAFEMPRRVAAWLELQQLRSEKMQFQMLQLQNLTDVWRRPAQAVLLAQYSAAMHGSPSEDVFEALKVFKEPVGMKVDDVVPEVQTVREVLDAKVAAQHYWVKRFTEAQEATVAYVKDQLAGDADQRSDNATALDVEQQLEQETEQEQQKELEQHTEMEKFIELEYSREDEQPTPWAFEELKTARGPPLGDAAAGASTAARAAPFFYGGSQFKLYRQQPVQLPTRQTARGEVEDLKVSTNFFNRAWSGERRLRNLIITLDGRRAPSAHEGALPIAPDMQPRLDACLDRIWKLLVSRKYERSGASVEAEGGAPASTPSS